MISQNHSFAFRLCCLLLAFLILVNSLFVPVRASVLYEVIAATTRNMIASLIRACGVYVSDGIQDSLSEGLSAWESLVDYISARVPAEYLYINAAGEKLVKMILKDGLYYADRNLVEWVIGMLTSMGENSSGDYVRPVGYGYPDMEQWQINQINSIFSDIERSYARYYDVYTRELPYCTFIDFTASSATLYQSPLVIFTEEEPCDCWFNSNSGVLFVNIPAGRRLMLWTDQVGGNGSYSSSSSTSYSFKMNVDGATVLDYEAEVTIQTHGGFGGSIDSISVESDKPIVSNSWSAAAVTVTDNNGSSVTALPVTVPSSSSSAATAPKNEITSGTKVEAPSVSVPGTDVGTQTKPEIGTDAETQTGFWSSVLSWLGSLWDVLSQILSGVLAIPIAIAQAIATAIADVIAAIKSLVPDPPSFDEFQIPSLQSFFPFCIPFDLLAMMRALNAAPVAPTFTFACPLPGGGVYTVNINLSAWDNVAATIRSVTMAIYVVALANSTRKFIKW